MTFLFWKMLKSAFFPLPSYITIFPKTARNTYPDMTQHHHIPQKIPPPFKKLRFQTCLFAEYDPARAQILCATGIAGICPDKSADPLAPI